jgi:hypothetical protein
MEYFEGCGFCSSMVPVVNMDWVALMLLNAVEYEYYHVIIDIDSFRNTIYKGMTCMAWYEWVGFNS